MKLNPSKCSFRMKEGHFLGFIITLRGIKANPKKIQAIENMQSPRSKKDVQSLNGKLAALTRFLSRATDRALPFFQTLKGYLSKKDFIWTDEAEKAFQDVKAFLKELPTLTAPIPGETLMVFTNQPIKHVLTRPEISGRMAKWVIELGEHEITFLPRHSVKGQVIADFLVELPSDMIKQGEMTKADALSKLASLLYNHFTKKVMVEVLERKSTEEDTLMATITTEEECWMTPFIKYLADGTLPKDKLQARRIRMRAPMYNFKNGIMYRKSFTEPYLRCVGPVQAKEIIQEMHKGACSTHSGYRTIVSRIKRMGYFWPDMYRDTYDLIVNREACQIHAPVKRSPRCNMIPIYAAWPFCKWGIDIVGPFPRGVGNVKFLVVAIDYFTKWVEEKPLSTITGRKILTFVWEDIVCHFSLP
ncbi:uncharacterized protein [Rutidosis leptorrhynchoides]|uniref:uncharacterized protein n=1 Tax=Rutidosis leptorrhynchoides TaxID=125765 RepID=UPI003A9A4375